MSRWSLALALGLACADDGVRLGTTTPRWRDAAPTEPLARRRYFANGSFELARDEWLFDLRCAPPLGAVPLGARVACELAGDAANPKCEPNEQKVETLGGLRAGCRAQTTLRAAGARVVYPEAGGHPQSEARRRHRERCVSARSVRQCTQ